MKGSGSVLLMLAGFHGILCAQTITQDEFLDQLRKEHPLFEVEELTPRIEREKRNGLLGAQDWNLVSSLSFLHENPALAIAAPERTDAAAFSGGVERLFWRTGGRLSAALTTTRADLRISPLFGIPDDFYQNQIDLTYVHPLMKNRAGFLDRLPYTLQQYVIDISEVVARENQEDFLASAADKFLDWVYLTEQKGIIIERLRLSQEELERTKRKREANLVEKVDVIRAEDAVRVSKQNRVLAESQWNALRAELAVLTKNDELYDLEPDYDLYKVEDLIVLEEAVSQIKEDSRLVQALNIRLAQLDLARRGFEEATRAELAVVAQINTKKLDESFGGSLDMDKTDVVLGLEFSIPIGNRTALSHLSKTNLEVLQLEKQVSDLVIDLTSTLTNLYVQITEMEEVLALNREQIDSAEEKTEQELMLYNRGRGDLTFVIQSRDSEQNARLLYAQNALSYHKLLVRHKALMDQLL